MKTQVENKYNLSPERDYGLVSFKFNTILTGNLGFYVVYDVDDTKSLLIENREHCKFYLSLKTPDMNAYEHIKLIPNSFPELIGDCNIEKVFIYHANILIDWFKNEYVNR